MRVTGAVVAIGDADLLHAAASSASVIGVDQVKARGDRWQSLHDLSPFTAARQVG